MTQTYREYIEQRQDDINEDIKQGSFTSHELAYLDGYYYCLTHMLRDLPEDTLNQKIKIKEEDSEFRLLRKPFACQNFRKATSHD